MQARYFYILLYSRRSSSEPGPKQTSGSISKDYSGRNFDAAEAMHQVYVWAIWLPFHSRGGVFFSFLSPFILQRRFINLFDILCV